MIPPLPSLRTYQVDISLRSHRSFNAYSPSRTPSALSSNAFATAVLPQIHLAPNLSIIHRSEPTEFCQPFSSTSGMPTWREPTFQGLLVYSYDNDTGDNLLHIRSYLGTVGEESSGDESRLFTQRIEETGTFNGVPVPAGVLAAVHARVGWKLSEKEPGRGMELPKEGWEVLRHWRLQQ